MKLRHAAILFLPLLALAALLLFLLVKSRLKTKASIVRWDRVVGPNIARLPSEEVAAIRRLQVAVVGGGLAGCAAANALANLGVTVVLYEREDVLGGRAATVRRVIGKWPIRLERGVDCVTSGCTAFDALVNAAGLAEDAGSINDHAYFFHRENAKGGVVVPGRSWYTLAGAADAGSPLALSRWDKVALMWFRMKEVFSLTGWDPMDPKSLASAGDGDHVKTSAAALAAQRFSPAVRGNVVEMLCRTMFHVGPEHVPAGWLRGMLAGVGMALRWNIDGGMGKLCQRLIDIHINPAALQPVDINAPASQQQQPAPAVNNSTLTARLNTGVTRITRQGNQFVITSVPIHGEGETPPAATSDVFDAVIMAVPGPVAAALTAELLPARSIPKPVRSLVTSSQYRPSVHVSYLVRTAEFAYRPKCPTLVPQRLGDEYRAGVLAQCPDWMKNAVAYVTFPSGRLETMVPPGQEVVSVYLTAEASRELSLCLSSPAAALPRAPKLPSKRSRVPDELKARMEAVSAAALPVKGGARVVEMPGAAAAQPSLLTPREQAVAELVWDIARFACPDTLPDLYDTAVAVEGWQHGWCDDFFQPGSHAWTRAVAAQHAQAQRTVLPALLFAGDYVGGGTAEGAVRSGLWAVDALLKASTRGTDSSNDSQRGHDAAPVTGPHDGDGDGDGRSAQAPSALRKRK